MSDKYKSNVPHQRYKSVDPKDSAEEAEVIDGE